MSSINKIPPNCEIFENDDYYEIINPEKGEITKIKKNPLCSFNGVIIPPKYDVYAYIDYFKIINLETGEKSKMREDELIDFLEIHKNDCVVNIQINDEKSNEKSNKKSNDKLSDEINNVISDEKSDEKNDVISDNKTDKKNDNQTMKCQCGVNVIKRNMKRHLISKQHKLWYFEKASTITIE
jgi:hypothetical protein